MKEARNNMLPIEMEAELGKDWDIIERKYQHFLPNVESQFKIVTKFPFSRRLSFRSTITGLTWNIVIAIYEKSGKESSYGFYTPYTNEHGQKGCYSITTDQCERITPHFLHRLQSRYMTPKGISANGIDEIMEFYYREMQPANTFVFQNKYMMLRHGIAIVDVAGNGAVTYITFVTYEMIRDYQTVYKRLCERMLELYEENNEECDSEKFVKVLCSEGLLKEGEEFRNIGGAPKRKLERKKKLKTLWRAKMEEIQEMKMEGMQTDFLSNNDNVRPSAQRLFSSAEMEDVIRKLRKN